MRWHPKHARPHQWFVKDGRPSLGRVAAAALAVATIVLSGWVLAIGVPGVY